MIRDPSASTVFLLWVDQLFHVFTQLTSYLAFEETCFTILNLYVLIFNYKSLSVFMVLNKSGSYSRHEVFLTHVQAIDNNLLSCSNGINRDTSRPPKCYIMTFRIKGSVLKAKLIKAYRN